MIASFAATQLLVVGTALAVDPSALQIRVRGGAQLEATASIEDGLFTLRGTLVDDVGLAIPRAALSLRAIPAEGAPLAEVPSIQACARSARGSAESKRGLVETEADGAFCARGRAPSGASKLRLRVEATQLHDAAEIDVALAVANDRSARTMLRFEPAVDVVELDRELVLFTGWLHVDRRDASIGEGAAIKREGLHLIVEDERGTRLGEALTAGDGRARFELPTASFEPPGAGEVRLRFDGAQGLAPAMTTHAIVRRARVSLALTHEVTTSAPEGDVTLEVLVTAARGVVSDGVVEALAAGASAGAGAVVDGRARVVATVGATRAPRIPLTLRYVPAAPWWQAGPELTVDVEVLPRSRLRPVLLAAVVLALGTWVLMGWRRAPRPASDERAPQRPHLPVGEAGLAIVEAIADASAWRGVVRDAHDGAPIARATLKIITPTFQGDGVVVSAVADERGQFALEAPLLDGARRTDARLIVDAPEHTRFERALPAPSRLDVALITRRRALVERLVRWARRQGAPFDSAPAEPTPGHIRRAAARAQATSIEAWATQTERAAFGPLTVDEEVERTVRAAEPNQPPGNAPLT
jgi:hypothetical protein